MTNDGGASVLHTCHGPKAITDQAQSPRSRSKKHCAASRVVGDRLVRSKVIVIHLNRGRCFIRAKSSQDSKAFCRQGGVSSLRALAGPSTCHYCREVGDPACLVPAFFSSTKAPACTCLPALHSLCTLTYQPPHFAPQLHVHLQFASSETSRLTYKPPIQLLHTQQLLPQTRQRHCVDDSHLTHPPPDALATLQVSNYSASRRSNGSSLFRRPCN